MNGTADPAGKMVMKGGAAKLERTLRQLFDFQKFEGNRELQQVIDSVHARHAVRELSLDEMEFVAAAGVPEIPDRTKKQGK